MRKRFLFLAAICISCWLSAQNASIFNGYKYVILEPITYGDGDRDYYDIEPIICRTLTGYGLVTMVRDKMYGKMKDDYKEHSNYFLTLAVSHNSENALYLTYTFINCNGEKVYSTTNHTDVYMYHFTYKGAIRKLVSRCNNDVYYKLSNYTFDSSQTPKNIFGHVDIDVFKARAYLDSIVTDKIEGIYKAVSGKAYQFLVKQNDFFGYDLILTENLDDFWSAGDVKATFEESAIPGIYAGKWLMYNKQASNITLTYDKEVLTVRHDNNMEDTYIKLYPKNGQSGSKRQPQTSGSANGANLIASGSGFLLNSKGIVGTNFHVVEGANQLMVIFSDGISQTEYNAIVVLSDPNNDVALLQITDSVSFPSIPYGVCTNTDIGAEVFTIGFPRPNAMGENFKVTNGIISASTGIGDDIRAYQITVPIQPGNSGGPLFDMKGNLLGITTATLSEKYIKAKVENVNYAVKISYLLNLYNMLPYTTRLKDCKEQTKADLATIVKKYKDYVCLIKVYE